MKLTPARGLLLLLGLAGVLLFAAPAPAEVSVEIDEAKGEYLGYHVRANKSSKNPRIWSFHREAKKGIYPVNTEGDRLGDGFPLIRENENADGLPWLIWDREAGDRRVLMWSRWTPEGWTAVRGLEGRGAGSQSQPDLAFNGSGRAYLAYVEPEAGLGVVRFTIFLKSDWALSIRVSSEGQDASSPSIVVLEDSTVEVSYSLGDGSRTTRTVIFEDPGTITDDVYPFLIDTATVTEGMLF